SSTNLFATAASFGTLTSGNATHNGTLTVSGLSTLTGGILTNASSTFGNFTALNATTSQATTSALAITGITSCSGSNALTTNSTGGVICGAISSSASFPFTPTLNFGVNTSATTTPLFGINGIFASSTSHFAGADFASTSTF